MNKLVEELLSEQNDRNLDSATQEKLKRLEAEVVKLEDKLRRASSREESNHIHDEISDLQHQMVELRDPS